MSEENVEIVRHFSAALTRGDEDTLRDLALPEFVLDFSRRLMDPIVLRGRDEAFAFFLSQAREAWDDLPAWEPQELIDADDNGQATRIGRLFGMSGGRRPTRATFRLLEAPDSLAEQSTRNPDGYSERRRSRLQ